MATVILLSEYEEKFGKIEILTDWIPFVQRNRQRQILVAEQERAADAREAKVYRWHYRFCSLSNLYAYSRWYVRRTISFYRRRLQDWARKR